MAVRGPVRAAGANTISQHATRVRGTPQGYDDAMSEQTVLVVDDEEAIAEAVRARLESEGYRVIVAADGPQAIEQHAEHHPDLVVLDLMLPGMDGLEVCKQIQRDGWTPVLMLTAKTEEADKVAGFAVGADDYLTKPFSLRELALQGQGDPPPHGAHARPAGRRPVGPWGFGHRRDPPPAHRRR